MALDQLLNLSGLLFVIQYSEGTGLGQGCLCALNPHALTYALLAKPYQSLRFHLQAEPHLPGDHEGQHWNQMEDPLEHRFLVFTPEFPI